MSLALQVAFLTGQSDPDRCALSPEQQAFLDRLPVVPNGRVGRNFPYAPDTEAYRPVPLLPASWHNAHQYLASRKPRFAERHRPAVLRMLSQAEQTVLLAGSCGLELLAQLSLPASALIRLHVFAYGPCARRHPDCDLVTVLGRHDWIARAWSGSAHHVVAATHFSYLTSPEVLALCRAFIMRVAAGVGSS